MFDRELQQRATELAYVEQKMQEHVKKMSATIRKQNFLLIASAVLFISFVIAHYQLKGTFIH